MALKSSIKNMMGKVAGVISKAVKPPVAVEQASSVGVEDPMRGFKRLDEEDVRRMGLKKGGKVSSASKRADGCAIRGKTRA